MIANNSLMRSVLWICPIAILFVLFPILISRTTTDFEIYSGGLRTRSWVLFFPVTDKKEETIIFNYVEQNPHDEKWLRLSLKQNASIGLILYISLEYGHILRELKELEYIFDSRDLDERSKKLIVDKLIHYWADPTNHRQSSEFLFEIQNADSHGKSATPSHSEPTP